VQAVGPLLEAQFGMMPSKTTARTLSLPAVCASVLPSLPIAVASFPCAILRASTQRRSAFARDGAGG